MSSGENNDNNVGVVYILASESRRRTYVGWTVDLQRRIRQHNGDIVGGAKATRGDRPWLVVGTVVGFATRSEALSFEWHAKFRRRRRPKGSAMERRRKHVDRVAREWPRSPLQVAWEIF